MRLVGTLVLHERQVTRLHVVCIAPDIPRQNAHDHDKRSQRTREKAGRELGNVEQGEDEGGKHDGRLQVGLKQD